VQKEGGQIVVHEGGVKTAGVPLRMISAIVVMANAQITTQVMFSFLKYDIPVVYTDWRGEVEGVLQSGRAGFSRLQKQFSVFSDAQKRLEMAKYVIRKKLANQLRLLGDYAKHRKSGVLKKLVEELRGYKEKIARAEDVEVLRGYEGICSRVYFSAFGEILDEVWQWSGRNRRPAQDPVNAILNYGYAFLEREIRLAIAGSALDERVGFFHSNNGRQDSLVYDLMEMFRQNVVDRLALRLFNKSVFHAEDFQRQEGGCRIADRARRVWITMYEEYLSKEDETSLRHTIRQEIAVFMSTFLGKESAACA